MSWDSMRSQGYASINRAEIRFDDQGKPSVDLYGGKEQGQIEIRYVHQPDGGTMAEYKAADVRAFDGQVIRGAVEQAISADVKEVAPGIVESVTGAVICAVTKLGC